MPDGILGCSPFLSGVGHVSEVGDGMLLKSGRVVQGRVMSGNYYDDFQT